MFSSRMAYHLSKRVGTEIPELNLPSEPIPLSIPGFFKVSEIISKLLFTFVFLSANPHKENKLGRLVLNRRPIKNLSTTI